MVIITLEEYAQMNKTQQAGVKRAELKEIIDAQLALLNNDPNEIRNVITTTINQAIDKKLDQYTRDFNTETKRLSDENIVLRKTILEQQTCIERISREVNKDNAFMTGIPCRLDTDNETLTTPKDIIAHILKFVHPNINDNAYTIVKAFNPKTGQTKHSAKVVFTSTASKNDIMLNTKKLKNLPEGNLLRKVFIKNETTPLARKENDRLYSKLRN